MTYYIMYSTSSYGEVNDPGVMYFSHLPLLKNYLEDFRSKWPDIRVTILKGEIVAVGKALDITLPC